MPTPSISVVIPAFNAERTIRCAIDSILSQTLPVAEIIVVDDGSSDATADVVQTYGTQVTFIQQANSRSAVARNVGIDAATGDFVAFLDADDYWEPHKIQRQIAVITQHPSIDVLGAGFYCQKPGDTRTLSSSRIDAFWNQPLRCSGSQAFSLGTMLWTGTVMVRRAALEKERFVSGLEPAEDRDLWIRLASEQTVFLDSEPLATAVLEPTGISRSNIALDCTKMLEVIERNQKLLSPLSHLLWKSYVRYRWAAIDPSPRTSLPLLMKSLASWPLPFTGMPAMKRLGRLKRLAYLLKQSVIRSNPPIASDASQGASL